MPRRRWALLVGPVVGLLVYGGLWFTISTVLRQRLDDVAMRDAYPIVSGAALFASAGFALGNAWRAGWRRTVLGAAAGTLAGWGMSAALLLHPYAVPLRVASLTVVLVAAAAGGVAGLAADRRAGRPTRGSAAGSASSP